MPSLKDRFNEGMKKVRNEARYIGIEAGLVEPTMLERGQRGARDLLKGAREEFGLPSGSVETIKEVVTIVEEKFGHDPRIGKSLLGVVKSAFGMVSAISGSESEQTAASEKFDKACSTFSKAMSALFKTKKQEHGKEDKSKDDKKPAHKPNAAPARDPKKVARLADIKARNEARKPPAQRGRGR